MSINVCLEMNPISREIELQNTLKNTGIGFQNSNENSKSPYQIKQVLEGYNPAIAIWGESQIPTDEEIELIQKLAKKEIPLPAYFKNSKPNIPGYTGKTHHFKTTSVSHYDLQGRPYTTTAAFHR